MVAPFLRRTGLLSVLLPLTLVAQTNTIRIEFDDGSPATTLGVFRRDGELYASLADIGSALSLSSFDNSATKKLELKSPSYRIVATSGNSFVTIIGQTGKRSVFQLPGDVIGAAGTYFVPLRPFIPLFHIASGRTAAYDVGTDVLHLSSPATGRGFDFSTLKLEPKSNGMLIRIPTTRPLNDFESWLKKDGWLYVTIGREGRCGRDQPARTRRHGQEGPCAPVSHIRSTDVQDYGKDRSMRNDAGGRHE